MSDEDKYRLLAVGCLLSAAAHLIAPRRLLAAAAVLYERVLCVEFSPKADAPRRVRLLAVPNLVVSLYCWLRATADST
ncbi:MAG: hypothetical protein PPP58_11015 [Natronomonas sp.]